MVKAIIFDFWGTLVENGVWSPINQVKRILNIDLPFTDYVVRMEKAMMTQRFESLTEAFTAVCTEFDITIDDEKLDQLIGMWNKSWMLAKPYLTTDSVLEDLSEYRLILVGNTNRFAIENVMKKFELGRFFEKCYYSYELGFLKTDPGFIEHVLSELDLEGSDCVWVGDSMQSDMEAAKKAGIKGILVDRKNKRDHSPKVLSLREIKQHI